MGQRWDTPNVEPEKRNGKYGTELQRSQSKENEMGANFTTKKSEEEGLRLF